MARSCSGVGSGHEAAGAGGAGSAFNQRKGEASAFAGGGSGRGDIIVLPVGLVVHSIHSVHSAHSELSLVSLVSLVSPGFAWFRLVSLRKLLSQSVMDGFL